MKRIAFLVAVCLAAVAAIAGVQSMDARITASKTVVTTPSKSAASVPVEVRVANAVPNSGTLAITAIHIAADGTPMTNTVASIQGTNGVYKLANAPYVLRNDRLVLTFSAVTNGTVCVVSDIKD